MCAFHGPLRAFDLNLLQAFEVLLEERSVTRAAARVGLSQPAMSNALARLRALVGDPLFRRASRSMAPTARALQMAGPVGGALRQLRAALEEPPAFDHAASTRTFRLAMTDYGEFLLLPVLPRRIRTEAPGIDLRVRRPEKIFVPPEAELQTGTFDAAIGFFPDSTALQSGT